MAQSGDTISQSVGYDVSHSQSIFANLESLPKRLLVLKFGGYHSIPDPGIINFETSFRVNYSMFSFPIRTARASPLRRINRLSGSSFHFAGIATYKKPFFANEPSVRVNTWKVAV